MGSAVGFRPCRRSRVRPLTALPLPAVLRARLRQVLALILGVVFGALPVTGAAGHMLFGSISAAALFLYYTKYLGVDDEDDKFGRWDLLVEGLWSSYALFLITWITVYSLPY